LLQFQTGGPGKLFHSHNWTYDWQRKDTMTISLHNKHNIESFPNF
jgi:hypothetical protein